MALSLRPGREEDASACARIAFEAFAAIANAHNFLPDFPNVEIATSAIGMMLRHPGFYGVVAELDGTIVGSNFLDERNPVSGLGPITVDPNVQDRGIGAQLMRAAMERSAARRLPGIRLVQAGYHCRSLSLYSKLGFEVREHLSCVQGPEVNESLPGYAVRSATERDIEPCNALCIRIHGHDRAGELRDAVAQGAATVVERGGRLTGYASQIAYFGHAVAETTDDLKALVGAARSFPGPGFLLPSRNGELLRWCLARGLKVMQPMTLMTMGLYSEPSGAWLPSILC
jgi:predicted N-acetyltransferase YhbS